MFRRKCKLRVCVWTLMAIAEQKCDFKRILHWNRALARLEWCSWYLRNCKTMSRNDAQSKSNTPRAAGGVVLQALYAGHRIHQVGIGLPESAHNPVGCNDTNTRTRERQEFRVFKVVTAAYERDCAYTSARYPTDSGVGTIRHYRDFRVRVENGVERRLKSKRFRGDKTPCTRRRRLIFPQIDHDDGSNP